MASSGAGLLESLGSTPRASMTTNEHAGGPNYIICCKLASGSMKCELGQSQLLVGMLAISPAGRLVFCLLTDSNPCLRNHHR